MPADLQTIDLDGVEIFAAGGRSDVRPHPPGYDAVGVTDRDVVGIGDSLKRLPGRSRLPDLDHDCVSQFGGRVRFASSESAAVGDDDPPLLASVSVIVGDCAEPEMVGADATPHVAAMENAQASRDGADGKFVGYPMCAEAISLSRCSYLAVPFAVARRSPEPALIARRLRDLRPEAFLDRLEVGHSLA